MCEMNGPTDTTDLRREVATRLRRTREAFKMGQGEFAAAAGIAFNTYNQYEQGARLMRLENAIALCDRFDITLDWIYRGDTSGLPLKTWRMIQGTVP
jgi:transcriptional regulator with XRE-family HTH domain